MMQQCFGVSSMVGINAHSDADANFDIVIINPVSVTYCIDNRVEHFFNRFPAGDVFEQYDEFVAAQPGDGIGFANASSEPVSNALW